MLDEGLNQLIASSAAVTSRVGASRKDKTTGIFGGQAPAQTPLPFVVIEQIGGDPIMTLDGPLLTRTARFKFSCHSDSRLAAKRLMKAVRGVLEGFTGMLPDGTNLQNAETVLEADAFEYAPLDYVAPLEVEMLYDDTGS